VLRAPYAAPTRERLSRHAIGHPVVALFLDLPAHEVRRQRPPGPKRKSASATRTDPRPDRQRTESRDFTPAAAALNDRRVWKLERFRSEQPYAFAEARPSQRGLPKPLRSMHRKSRSARSSMPAARKTVTQPAHTTARSASLGRRARQLHNT